MKRNRNHSQFCSIKDCENLYFSKDLCDMHYRRMKRYGDPNYINPKCNRDGLYKIRHREYVKQWKKDNRKKNNAYNAARKKRVKQATPKWADLKAIEAFYYNCPEGYHVDHIIPLKGKTISGLHVLENLQYLPAIENLRKSNKE